MPYARFISMSFFFLLMDVSDLDGVNGPACAGIWTGIGTGLGIGIVAACARVGLESCMSRGDDSA